MPDAGAQLEAGRAAVEAGNWAAARDAFAAALGAGETADALLGLGGRAVVARGRGGLSAPS